MFRPSILLSEADDHGRLKDARVLIIDCIGMLSKLYRYATISYVGGGFNAAGIHNILEPAVFGLPVMYGPNHKRFPEGQHFIDAAFGFSVENTQQTLSAISKIKSSLEEIKSKEMAFIQENAGSSERIYDKISRS